MRNAFFFIVTACLLAGCGGKGPPVMKLKTEVVDIKSEQGLPVKVMPHDEKPLLIKVVPDENIVRAFVALLITACATTLAAIAAWRAAYNTRKALEKIKKRSDE